jgi:hypothetical protein
VLSSGTPEICDYPFTTRSIKMGHFYVDARKHQVTDTPGLLARPDGERNAMELLTLAALSYLPSRWGAARGAAARRPGRPPVLWSATRGAVVPAIAPASAGRHPALMPQRPLPPALKLSHLPPTPRSVVFVADLTEGCGTSCADQWEIRSELRQRCARAGAGAARMTGALSAERPQSTGPWAAGAAANAPLPSSPSVPGAARRFPNKTWFDVLSKSDLLSDVWELADSPDTPSSSGGGGSSSSGSGSGCGPAAAGGERGADGEATTSGRGLGGAGGGSGDPGDPVLAFARLPGALRVSSLTGVGVDGLKQRVMAELQAQAAAAAAAAAAAGGPGDSGGGGLALGGDF